jgi:transcriptional regulator with PAS, ATPase and Fis domain
MAASTTLPSASTEIRRGGAHAPLLRWVFPRSFDVALAGRLVVGRDDTCGAVLVGNEISRTHAEFRVDGAAVVVRDLDSRNGVFVNGARVGEAALQHGDVVRCGEWIGVLWSVGLEDGHGFSQTAFGEQAPGLWGSGTLARALAPARRLIARLPVVVQGETGTGKEGTARAVHAWSGRKGAFIAVNCAALPAELAEAELFGYRKGAFTGADKASPGLFRAAHGGSLFLDEILELPLPLQAKLLRAIEYQQVRALGETQDVPIDVRIIVATQQPLSDVVAAGEFRADLQARLEGLIVTLPPLRARREDVAPLFLKFLEAAEGARRDPARIEPRLVEALCLHDWPLNVRELSLLTQRLVAVHGGEPVLKRSHLPETMLARQAPARPASETGPSSELSGPVAKPARRATDDDAEYEALLRAIREHGTVAKAAAAIGVSRNRAYRLIAARK